MFARPGDGALVPLALIAAFALVKGIAECVVAIGGKRLIESDLKRACGEGPTVLDLTAGCGLRASVPPPEPTPSA